MGFRYEVLRCMTDNAKTQLKQFKTRLKQRLVNNAKHRRQRQRQLKPTRLPTLPLEPMNVVWDDQGRWRWAIEAIDDDDDDDNPFGEDWDDAGDIDQQQQHHRPL